jgi:outer membrane protein OmpA-like peptidoglycan-associated protein
MWKSQFNKSTATGGLVFALFGLIVSACGMTSPSATSDAARSGLQGCLIDSRPRASAPVVLVAVDIAAADQTPGAVAAERAAFATIVPGAFAMHADIELATFGAAPSDDAIVTGISGVGQGPNSEYVRASTTCMESGLIDRFNALTATTSAGKADLLEGMSVLTADVAELSPSSTSVVVLGQAVPDSKPVDLTDPVILSSDPKAGAKAAEAGGILPKSHAAWYFAGVGSSLTGEQLDGLTAWLWWLTHVSGGSLHAIDPTGLTAFPSAVLDAPAPLRPVTLNIRQNGTELEATAPSSLLFSFDSSTLSPGATPSLDQLLSLVRAHTETNFTVAGYTDSIGTPAYNQQLSVRRAQTVADWLESHGVPLSRLNVVGNGASDPIASDATSTGRADNRRVVLTGTVSP